MFYFPSDALEIAFYHSPAVCQIFSLHNKDFEFITGHLIIDGITGMEEGIT